MKTVEIAEQDFIQMKEELDSLKKLVSENIKLNDSAILRSMQKKVDDINRFAIRITILGLIAMCFMLSVFLRVYHLPTAFIIASELMMLFFSVATVIMHFPVRKLDFAHESLVEAAEKISRFKRQYTLWPCIGIPMVTLWLGWFLYEIYTGMGYEQSQFIILCSGALCGAVLGGSIGWRNNRRIIQKTNEILEELRYMEK